MKSKAKKRRQLTKKLSRRPAEAPAVPAPSQAAPLQTNSPIESSKTMVKKVYSFLIFFPTMLA
jgi:hypothetical protein